MINHTSVLVYLMSQGALTTLYSAFIDHEPVTMLSINVPY